MDDLLADWPAQVFGPESALLRAWIAGTAIVGVALAAGPRLIAWLATRCREPIKSASADITRLHQSKAATPTMGGIFLVAAIVLACVGLGDWSNPLVPLAVWQAIGFGLIGAADDRIKLTTARRGLRARTKFAAQVLVALVTAILLYRVHSLSDPRMAVLLPGWGPLELGAWWISLATIVMVGASNAVNLSDGLDGLAGGCTLICAITLGAVAALVSQETWANACGLAPVAHSGEMVLLAGAIAGAVIGFLWFNCHPAAVFMGDSGSLPLGALLGLIALAARQEFLFLIVGGVFVAETLSVVIQVACFQCTRRRVFLCAPLHHHYQLRGWGEPQIVARFWIAAVLCAVVGLGTLKLQSSDQFSAPQVAGQETAQTPELLD